MNDTIIRQFWADKLQTPISKDGQIRGFSDWWFHASPEKRAEAVRDMRAYLTDHGSDEPIDPNAWDPGYDAGPRSSPAYSSFRWNLIKRIQQERLTPKQVAEALWEHRIQHMDHGEVAPLDEIASYESAGDDWRRVRA